MKLGESIRGYHNYLVPKWTKFPLSFLKYELRIMFYQTLETRKHQSFELKFEGVKWKLSNI